MVPVGEVTGKTIEDLTCHMAAGDMIIDSGNCYRDTSVAPQTCPSGDRFDLRKVAAALRRSRLPPAALTRLATAMRP